MVHIDHVGVLEWDGARTIRARPIKGGLETNPGSNAHGEATAMTWNDAIAYCTRTDERG
jgi:hypothetical protein